MWCPWKQQHILTKDVQHLCGSPKCYFNALHHFLKRNCGLEKLIGSHVISTVTISVC